VSSLNGGNPANPTDDADRRIIKSPTENADRRIIKNPTENVDRPIIGNPTENVDRQIILASGSPRRIDLLQRFVPSLKVVRSDIEEVASGPPQGQVRALAERKARDVGRRQHGLIVAADTMVAVDGKMLGKPDGRADARKMLRRLSGRGHTVWTGLCVLDSESNRLEEAVESTTVWFRRVTEEEIEVYLALGEYHDKAGAYAIQGAAAVFVERIEGDYYNVIGLPLCRLDQLLERFGRGLLSEHAGTGRGTQSVRT